MPAASHRFTGKKRAAFLDRLRQGHSVSAAARAVGFSRRSVYDHREADAAFRADWDDALAEGTDVLEDEVWRRAVEGTGRPVYYQGVRCGTIQEYSDTLAIVLLKGRRPDVYKDNATLTHKGDPTAPLVVVPIDYRIAVAPLATGPVGDSAPPGQDEGPGDGEEMG